MDGNIRVLHVDDDPDICSVTALQLEAVSSKISVEAATEPKAVLERLAAEQFDCLVSDFEMPGMDGLELLDAVRDDHPDFPFILLTGRGSEEIASKAISAGVTGYLQKDTGTEQYEMLANRITNAVERNRSKGALADSQRRFRLLVEQLPLGVIEWDRQFEAVRWNDAAADIFGYTAAEALGTHVSAFLPESAADCVSEIGPELLDAGTEHGQQAAIRRDGERIVCEWHNLTIVEHKTHSTFTLVQEVTERRERERELEQYETMVETVIDGVYTLDDELRFTAVNEGMVALTGYDREELAGAHLSLVLDDEDIERVERGRSETRRSDADDNNIDLTVTTADGARVPCEVRYRVQRTDGAFTGTAGIFRPVN